MYPMYKCTQCKHLYRLDSTVWQERSEALDDAERQLKDANINPVLGSDFRASLKVCRFI